MLYPLEDFSSFEISAVSRLLVVDRITYLGIVIHKDVRQFDTLILGPMRQYITQKQKALEGLPFDSL